MVENAFVIHKRPMTLLFIFGLWFVSIAAQESVESTRYLSPDADSEGDTDFWRRKSFDALHNRLTSHLNTNVAKNVIFFLGDGMGVSTVTAGRIYKGQKSRNSGEEAELHMDTFPHTSICKTYCVDRQTTDSAASGTAYLCGVKTNIGVLGLNAQVKRSDCEAAMDRSNHVESLLAWAQKAGKWTGLVTTDQIVGASTAAAYAHSSNRVFYSKVPEGCQEMDIASQLIHGKTGFRLRVILGGGRKHFLPKNMESPNEPLIDANYPEIIGRGARTDGRNLIVEWLDKHNQLNHTAAYMWNKKHLQMMHEGDYNEDYILGLFGPDSLNYAMEKIVAQNAGEEVPGKDQPSLEEMTRAAIHKLSRSPSGFVLFVEGARIDTAHHDNLAGYSLEEVYQFDKAIGVAGALTSEKDTLTIVTADHSHAFTINGYAFRGTDILGHAGKSPTVVGHSILSYATGPGAVLNEKDNEQISSVNDFLQPAMVHMRKGVHGGEDVAVYAKGPWAHLFTGTHDNTFIPHALAFASCIGPRPDDCEESSPLNRNAHCVNARASTGKILTMMRNNVPSLGNLTILDHINGRPIASDKLNSPPSQHVPYKKQTVSAVNKVEQPQLIKLATSYSKI